MTGLFKKQAEIQLPTQKGQLIMEAWASSPEEPMPHIILRTSDALKSEVLNLRIHSECMTGDVFYSNRCDCGGQLAMALDYIEERGGMVIYLRQEGRGIGLINKMHAYNLQDTGMNTVEANVHLGFEPDGRTYDRALEMLQQLQVKKVNLLTNNPVKIQALEHHGIQVINRIPIEVVPNASNHPYLKAKADHLGHVLQSMSLLDPQ